MYFLACRPTPRPRSLPQGVPRSQTLPRPRSRSPSHVTMVLGTSHQGIFVRSPSHVTMVLGTSHQGIFVRGTRVRLSIAGQRAMRE